MLHKKIKPKRYLTSMVTIAALEVSPIPSLWHPTPVVAQTNTNTISVELIENLSFASFASTVQGGEFIASPELIQILGWNPSTTWKTGDIIIDFMPIGHFDNLGNCLC